MTPDEHLPGSGQAGKGHRGGQAIKRLGPIVPPDLEVDIDHVVGGLGQTQKAVGEVERALLAESGVMPDDPDSPSEIDRAKSRGRRIAAKIGAAAGCVGQLRLR